MARLRVISWNVNGIRACQRKGFSKWLSSQRNTIVALQEVRAFEEQIPDAIRRGRWRGYYAAAERPGYSGVGILSRRPADEVQSDLAPRFDVEGRMLLARFGRLWICSAYFPKGSGRERDNSRVPYKLAFDRALRKRLRMLSGPVLVVGDFNTAHHEIDLARPKSNRDNSGFLPEERRAMTRWLREGWRDTFRFQHPDSSGHYTWWSQRGGLRERNVGWRIDYVLANQKAQTFVKKAFILPEVRGSDHCPVGVDLVAEGGLR